MFVLHVCHVRTNTLSSVVLYDEPTGAGSVMFYDVLRSIYDDSAVCRAQC